MSSLPIGIFDSGAGGLTVLRQVKRLLPKETILYFADTANLPYGEKSPEEILRCVLQKIEPIASKIKLLVIACHTASCHALKALEDRLSIPVIGMIEPCLEELKKGHHTRIGLLTTSSTLQSGIYQQLLQEHFPSAELFCIACPLLASAIEFGHPFTKSLVRHYLTPLLEKDLTTALLACTHYPLILPLFKEILGPAVQIVDPAEECARLVQRRLSQQALSL